MPREKKKKPEAVTKPQMGRPRIEYTQELAAKICKAVATSTDAMAVICARNPDFPKVTTIHEWRFDYPDFSKMYLDAKRAQSELLAEEVIEIADESDRDEIIDNKGNVKFNAEYAARSKLRMDARKWVAARLCPRIYGDKAQVNDEQAPASKADIQRLQEDMANLIKQHEKEY